MSKSCELSRLAFLHIEFCVLLPVIYSKRNKFLKSTVSTWTNYFSLNTWRQMFRQFIHSTHVHELSFVSLEQASWHFPDITNGMSFLEINKKLPFQTHQYVTVIGEVLHVNRHFTSLILLQLHQHPFCFSCSLPGENELGKCKPETWARILYSYWCYWNCNNCQLLEIPWKSFFFFDSPAIDMCAFCTSHGFLVLLNLMVFKSFIDSF